MDCSGAEDFGCQMDQMGGWFADFLDTFGSPASAFLFIVLIVAFVVLVFMAVHNALQ